MQEREAGGQRGYAEHDKQLASGGALGAPALPILTSCSAPQTGSATSFFQWMQQRMDEAAPAAPPPLMHDPTADADAEGGASDATAAAVAELPEMSRPLLRDVRSRSDMTYDAATSQSAAATVAAAWLQGPQPSAASTSPADLLVQSHLQRHLSLAQRSMPSPNTAVPTSQIQPTSLLAAAEAASSAHPKPEDTRHPRSQTMPVRRDSTSQQDTRHVERLPGPPHTSGASPPRSPLPSSPSESSLPHLTPFVEPTAIRSTVRFADAVTTVEAGEDGGRDGSEAAPGPRRGSSAMDPFPLYTLGKGNRLYSVVLAATRRAARQQDRAGGGGPASSPAGGESPFSDASLVTAADRAVGLEEIGAMAQVEWGLRRWRQIAKRVKPSMPLARRLRSVEDVLPEEVRRARNVAEMALRFRGSR